MNSTVGFQGVAGSFGEEALLRYFGESVSTRPHEQFKDIFIALEEKEIKYGVLPIENSSAGVVTQVYDLLNQYEKYIVGEVYVKAVQNLMGIKGSRIEEIKEVYSHPQAIEQSRVFLSQYPRWKIVPYYNTAKSAELVKQIGSKSIAAIASKKAAEIYGLEILKGCIHTNDTNTTRFIILSNSMLNDDKNNKISIVFSTAHKAGSLYEVLRYFAESGINMMKIESRPIQHKPWEYFFYVDIEGNTEDGKVQNAIEQVKNHTNYFKFLGNYAMNSCEEV